MVGTDVSQVVVDPAAKTPRRVEQLLASGQDLATLNTNFRGLQQLAGYAHMPSIESLVVVHVPAKLVEANIRNTAIPWAIGLALIAGLLIPLSVGLLHHSYVQAHQSSTIATAKLSDSEERFRGLCTHVPAGIVMCDADGGCTYANDYCLDLMGIAIDDVFGWSWVERLHPEDRDRVPGEWRAAVKDCDVFISEFRFVRPNGDVKWVFARATALFDSDGNVSGHVGSFIDVTLQKQAEITLRQNEERNRGFIENSSQGIYLCEFDEPMPIDLPEDEQIVALSTGCHFAFCNDVFARMYGFESGEEMLGMRAIELYQTHDNEANVEFLQSMIRNGYQVIDEISEEFDRHGQRVVFANNCLGIVEDGYLTRVWGTQLDVTDRVQAERAVQASEERFRTLVSSAPLCIHEIDLEGRLQSMNIAGLKMMGMDQENDVVGADYLGAVCEADRDRIAALFDEAREGTASEFEFTASQDAGARSFSSSFIPIVAPDGQVERLMGITEDITDRKLAETERENLITELGQKNAELERFTYTVSHDLKSPLVTIGGFLGMLERDLAEQNLDTVHEDIREIAGAADVMKQLLDQLLDLSRIGRVVNPAEDVPFGELVSSVLQIVSPASHVRVVVNPDLPTLRCDRIRMREVLQNLLSNAVKFTQSHSDPCIEVGVQKPQDGEAPVLFVRDNGIGIDPQYSERIFDLFEQLDSSMEGTGIGLTLCRRIVENHGGRIWVQSAGPGTGCTFFFTVGAC